MQPLKTLLHLLICFLFIGVFGCKAKTSTCMGKADPDRMCTMDYRPVCGCNGVTYSNACVAGAAGVLKWTEGECK